MFGFPLIAFVNSYILNPIFNRYIPEDEKKENPDELRPILQDVIMNHPDKKDEEGKEWKQIDFLRPAVDMLYRCRA